MKTKKSLNPQIVAPVSRTTATSGNNASSPGVDAQAVGGAGTYWPFSGDDAE
ncbi:MAG TPA: anacyclamide/piricyclamide family prenylated cyclic peptide [Cyanobacteria bacterium UBA11372]|nr:anacyclamide/piricyclamide family prenylated cyclic peptide [Cyanobacteria bacterium UBA11372]